MKRQIIIAGDSHTIALKDALRTAAFKEPEDVSISALRLMNEKKASIKGDMTYDEVLELASNAAPETIIVMALRGNQYNTIGLMRHPVPFDFMMPNGGWSAQDDSAELIPYSTMRQYFVVSLQKGYGRLLRQIADVSKCAICCLAPPAPKEDADHIKLYAETFFREGGISDVGVSPATLRQKLWTLQNAVLQDFCLSAGIRFFWPPEGSRDEAGFLAPALYACDATHGNAAYGALVLQQIIDSLDEIASGNKGELP